MEELENVASISSLSLWQMEVSESVGEEEEEEEAEHMVFYAADSPVE